MTQRKNDLRVAAQVAIQHDGVGVATEFVHEGAKNLGGSCVFQRDRHAINLPIGVNYDVQVNGRIVARRQRLRCRGDRRGILDF